MILHDPRRFCTCWVSVAKLSQWYHTTQTVRQVVLVVGRDGTLLALPLLSR
jgi:hypothetical protein